MTTAEDLTREPPAPRRQTAGLWADVQSTIWLIKTCYVLLALLIVVTLLAPVLAPHAPNAQSLLSRLSPPVGFDGYREGSLLGTDELGWELYARVLDGLRFTLLIAVIGSIISMFIGSIIGVISGNGSVWVDNVLMAHLDIQIAFPFTSMALLVLAVCGTDLTICVIIIRLADRDKYARFVRGQMLAIRHAPYIDTVRVTGAGP